MRYFELLKILDSSIDRLKSFVLGAANSSFSCRMTAGRVEVGTRNYSFEPGIITY
jgi:hypothetical protein